MSKRREVRKKGKAKKENSVKKTVIEQEAHFSRVHIKNTRSL